MFTLGEVRDWRPVKAGLWCSEIGLVGLTVALTMQAGYIAVACGTSILIGMTFSAWALVQSLSTRKKRALDPGVLMFLVGSTVVLAAAIVGLLLAWPTSPFSSAPGGGFGAMVYGVLVFIGGLLPVIAGMMCKVVPFLTWMRAYGPKVGRMPTPAAGALTRPRVELWAFALLMIAVLPLGAGVWLHQAPLLRCGAWLLAAGVVLFLCDMGGVLRHLWFPVVAVAPTRKPAAP
jgi:hypothetical protein